ncbi:hypothetical protein SFRURICE_015971 [Spodoptera frugiperda]|nr:hypothetical protein SFRURICE_015971 [Spodoptera frugiperda]
MAHKVKNNHYVATHRSGIDSPSSGGYIHRASSREENDSHRAPSERTLSEYTTMDERTRSPSGEHRNGRRHQHTNGSPRADSGSDSLVIEGELLAISRLRATTEKFLKSRKMPSNTLPDPPAVPGTSECILLPERGGSLCRLYTQIQSFQKDAMAAPNPFCPNVKGMCCLMLLLNLGLILVTLGFVIVLQFFEPLILGIVFLIFGFLTLLGSLIYCVVLCRENPYPRYPDDFYWTHHWSKTIGPSEIHYSASEKQYVKNGHSDRYNNKYNGKYSDRESAKGYSDRESKLSRY